jgi:hypothetical protein
LPEYAPNKCGDIFLLDIEKHQTVVQAVFAEMLYNEAMDQTSFLPDARAAVVHSEPEEDLRAIAALDQASASRVIGLLALQTLDHISTVGPAPTAPGAEVFFAPAIEKRIIAQ